MDKLTETITQNPNPSSVSVNPNRTIQSSFDLGSHSTSLQITVIRLNGKNYLEWAQSVKLAIDGRGKLWFLTREEAQLAAVDPTFRKWRLKNSLITAWLPNSMEESIRKPYMFMTAKEIWEVVREMYSNL